METFDVNLYIPAAEREFLHFLVLPIILQDTI